LIDGLFDAELFPLFYNDVDLCYRLRQHGIPVVCKASDGVYHLKGASIDRLDIGNNLYQKLSGARNFFKKHKKTLDYFLTNVVFLMYSAIRKISGTKKTPIDKKKIRSANR
jgi:GT2 family glycosyltransferase